MLWYSYCARNTCLAYTLDFTGNPSHSALSIILSLAVPCALSSSLQAVPVRVYTVHTTNHSYLQLMPVRVRPAATNLHGIFVRVAL